MTKLVRGRAPPGNEAARLSRGGEAEPKRFIRNSNAQTDNVPHLNLQARRSVELRRLRRQRYVQRLCDLDVPRLWLEFVNHVAERFDLDDQVDDLLDRYCGVNIEVLRALGCDRLPPMPIHEVR